MKKVKYFGWDKVEGASYMARNEKGEALFLQFGVDFEYHDVGVGNYSTAIIQLDNGEIKNLPVEDIVFFEEDITPNGVNI